MSSHMNMLHIAFSEYRGTRHDRFAAVSVEPSLFARTSYRELTKVWDKR